MSRAQLHLRDMQSTDAAADVSGWLRAARFYLTTVLSAPSVLEVSSALHDKLMANVAAGYPLGADAGMIDDQLMIRRIPIHIRSN